MKVQWKILLILCAVGNFALYAQEPTDQNDLLRDLKSASTTDQASAKLLKRAKSDANVRKLLADALPPVIQEDPRGALQVWMNAVRLAGELRIADTADALAKWIDFDDSGITSLSGHFRLQDRPAARSLAQIGDPAIPALTGVLDKGTAGEREEAMLALHMICSPQANKILRERLANEPDSEIKARLTKLLQADAAHAEK